MPLASQQDQVIDQWLIASLQEVESRFAAELVSDLSCVNQLAGHIEQYRGKMLRPRLVLVAAMACPGTPGTDGELSDSHRVLATVVEMVHMATLVHDDILDDASLRRRGHTMNHLEGNETAVMLGDYLISHAYHLCSSLDNQAIARAIAATTNTVCEGELLQLANRGCWHLDEQTYFQIIRRKTASLCGACCRLSAMLSQATEQVADGLETYGQNVGMAFQIVDDLLDLIGVEDTVGKTLGRDLDKRKLTLPLIRHLQVADRSQRDGLLAILQSDRVELGDKQMDTIRKWITDSDAVAYAADSASRLIDEAKAGLAVLPDSPARAMLLAMAQAVLTRQF